MQVLGMHSGGDSLEDLEVFLGAAQVGFPILLDANPVHQLYRQSGAASPYPLDYVIDPLGRVAYAATEYDPEAMIAVVDSLLAAATTVVDPPTFGLRLSQADTPDNQEVRLLLTLPREDSTWLEIHDLRGRSVRRLIAGEVLAAGNRDWTWNGRDDRNRGLASGLYLARLRQGSRSITTKIRLVR